MRQVSEGVRLELVHMLAVVLDRDVAVGSPMRASIAAAPTELRGSSSKDAPPGPEQAVC